MIHWPAIFSGLGLIHYWSIAESFRQYYRLFVRKLPFDNFGFLLIVALGADLACLASWGLGYGNPDDVTFLQSELLNLVPVPFVIAAVLYAAKHLELKRNSLADQYLNNRYEKGKIEMTAQGTFVLTTLSYLIMLVIDFYLRKPITVGYHCKSLECRVYDLLAGDDLQNYGWVTVHSIFVALLFSAAALAYYGMVLKTKNSLDTKKN
jgi:hypothetical protein